MKLQILIHGQQLLLMTLCALTVAIPIQSHGQCQTTKLLGSDIRAHDGFGSLVAIDGNYAVIGAPFHEGEVNEPGAAYIFERHDNGNWFEVKRVKPFDGDQGGYFGAYLAMSDNVILVGAPSNSSACKPGISCIAGAAYVFERDKTGKWTEVKKLIASDALDHEWFGSRLDVSGDVAIVSNSNYFKNFNSDRVYVFSRDHGGDNNWGEVRTLSVPDVVAEDKFGYKVAISGDFAIVGAPGDSDNGAVSVGAAYVFARHHGGKNHWEVVKKLIASDGAEGDEFGWDVAISGDVAIVGAPWKSDFGIASGSAFIFSQHHGGKNNWGQVKKITPANLSEDDAFGFSVDVSGDLAVVTGNDRAGNSAGAAYVFARDEGGIHNWGELKRLTSSDTKRSDNFGNDVGITADSVIVGVPSDDDLGIRSGSAFIFTGFICPADINCDEVVDVNDLRLVVAHWGRPDHQADITNDGIVNVQDLKQVIAVWGPCP